MKDKPCHDSLAALAALCLVGCVASPTNNTPSTIRETGYLTCVAAPGCDGTFCTAVDGGETCEPLPASCAAGVGATCECAGATLCGAAAVCREIVAGIACAAPDADYVDMVGLADAGHDRPDVVPRCAAGETPLLDLGAAGVRFASGTFVGESDATDLVVQAAGCDAVLFHAIRIEGSPFFAAGFVDEAGAPRDLADPDADGVPGLSPGRSASLRIVYAPVEAGRHQAEVVVQSNAAPGEHRVSAEGDAVACIPATPLPAEYLGAPGVPIPLDATYVNALGELESFDWLILSMPAGSTARVTDDDSSTPAAVLVPDVAGKYRLRLETRGPHACSDNPDAVVFAPEPVGLVAAVTWRHGDLSSDAPIRLGTHLVAPWGSMFQTPGDCYASNTMPDWGVPGEPGDNPELGLEHGTLSGMAAFALPMLEDTVVDGPYRLVAVYEEGWHLDPGPDPGYPPTTVRVQVYWDGELVLDHEEVFDEPVAWEAVDVHFEAGTPRFEGLAPPI